MAKTESVCAVNDIEYKGKKYNPQSKPFEMDEEHVDHLVKKGIVARSVAAGTTKLKIETKE